MIYLLLLFFIHLVATEKKEVVLPEPKLKGTVSVEEAIFKRRSIRRYKKEPLKLHEVSQLLWACGGKTIDGITGPTRAYASAGGIYPLEIYLVAGNVVQLKAGIYKYNWKEHKLTLIKEGDFREELARACLGQRMVLEAPISIVLTAIYGKTTTYYGERGRVRYLPMDVGHAGQNVHLQAEALGLGSVMIGAFIDSEVEKILGAGKDETAVYVMPVGRPR